MQAHWLCDRLIEQLAKPRASYRLVMIVLTEVTGRNRVARQPVANVVQQGCHDQRPGSARFTCEIGRLECV